VGGSDAYVLRVLLGDYLLICKVVTVWFVEGPKIHTINHKVLRTLISYKLCECHPDFHIEFKLIIAGILAVSFKIYFVVKTLHSRLSPRPLNLFLNLGISVYRWHRWVIVSSELTIGSAVTVLTFSMWGDVGTPFVFVDAHVVWTHLLYDVSFGQIALLWMCRVESTVSSRRRLLQIPRICLKC